MYTHTFEINIGGKSIEGEVSFNGSNKPKFTTQSTITMTVEDMRNVVAFLGQLSAFCIKVGEITRLEITKK